MKTITANGVELMLVEVPEDASEIELNGNSLEYVTDLDSEFHDIDITKNVTKLLGTITNGVVDFDVEGLQLITRNNSLALQGYYKQAFIELLAANGITVKKIVCLKIK